LQGIVLDIATNRRLTLTLTLTVFLTVVLEMAENGGPSELPADTQPPGRLKMQNWKMQDKKTEDPKISHKQIS